MIPKAEQSNEEPESQKPPPWDTLVRHLFPEGREQQHEQHKSPTAEWLPPVPLTF